MKHKGLYNKPVKYRIRVKGSLDPSWQEWFHCEEIIETSKGETILMVETADQSALHGVLNVIRDMGLFLIELSLQKTQGGTNE